MDTQVVAREFELCVSMSDLAAPGWVDVESCRLHPALRDVLSVMGGQRDLMALFHAYFDDVQRAGRGDVHVFEMSGFPESVVVLDLYSDPTDQLDLIQIYLRCLPRDIERVSELLMRFFSNATCQVAFRRVSWSTRLREAIDRSRFPRNISGSHAPQLLQWHSAA
jgi:hypothetical protein